VSANEVMSAIRKPYLSQLTQRSKTKAITVNDLRSITSQIWLTSENFETLISENTITSEVLCQFYTDFHEIEDIDERLNKVNNY
jgi:thioredoxin-like negative regulator of GroEL